MKKHSKTFMTILCAILCMSLMMCLTGCGEEESSGSNSKSDKKSESSKEKEATATPTEAVPTPAPSYKWDEITFEFTELSEDLGTWGSQLNAPQGKYLMATFTITEGKISISRLDELILQQGNITLNGQKAVTLSSQGIEILENTAYANKWIYVFFDVAKDFDLANAVIEVK